MQNPIGYLLLIAIITNSNSQTINIETSTCGDCGTHLSMMAVLIQDYQRWSNTGVSVSCYIDLKSILSSFTEMVDKKLLNVVSDINSTFSVIPGNSLNTKRVVSAIQQGNFDKAKEYFGGNPNHNLSKLITSVYGGNLTYAENLLKFLNSLSNIDDTILGYRILFQQMVEQFNIYNSVTTSIAYQVMNVFNITRTNNKNMIYLQEFLPNSLKTFPWNNILSIHNVYKNELFFGPVEDDYKFDTSRRNSFTYKHDCLRKHCQWSFIPNDNGSDFNIKNNLLEEFLYADTNTLAFDIERRHVYTWIHKEQQVEASKWIFEPIDGSEYFKIKNTFWNEYLYIDLNDNTLSPICKECRFVFTRRSGVCIEDGCKWIITRA